MKGSHLKKKNRLLSGWLHTHVSDSKVMQVARIPNILEVVFNLLRPCYKLYCVSITSMHFRVQGQVLINLKLKSVQYYYSGKLGTLTVLYKGSI